MRSLLDKIRRNSGSLVFPGLLCLIVFIVFLLNYSPGTWLSGWDTLHPEFDFPLNFQRIFNGVWREEQGLGAVAGHSHMSELPRMIFLWLFSFVFPASFLRYFYFFVCLVIGPLGVYFFINNFVFPEKNTFFSKSAGFFGGLFYFLNLGTVQHFYVPFEMFTTQFGFLPWIFITGENFLLKRNRKNFIIFLLTVFFASPMAYASSLWFVFFGFYFIYLFCRFIVNKETKKDCKKYFLVIFGVVLVNCYWLLPNFYFLKTSAKNVPYSKTNLMFSEKAFSYDTKYATLGNASILKGFLFDWQKYNGSGFVELMGSWNRWIGNKKLLGYLLFFGVILGLLYSIFFEKKKFGLTLLPSFLFSFVFLIHGTGFLAPVFEAFRGKFDIFKEGLRFPWTKFSIPVIFCYSVYFSFLINGLFKFISRHKSKGRFFSKCLILFVSVLIIYWCWPIFKGEMINPMLRVKIPNSYFETFSYFKKIPKNERIAIFPSPSIFGWEYYRWGFEGAGFIWFGLKQPVLVRDFDRWNGANENYFWESSYAVYSQNQRLFESVLEKYNIHWVIVDESIINPAWPKSVYFEKAESLMSDLNKFSLEKTFGNIKIYKVKGGDNGFVSVADNLINIAPEVDWNNNDTGFFEYGDYYSGGDSDVYYPFRSLFTGRNQEELKFTVLDQGEYFSFSTVIPGSLQGQKLFLPFIWEEVLEEIDSSNLTSTAKNDVSIYLDDKLISSFSGIKSDNYIDLKSYKTGKLTVKIPKIYGYFSFDSRLSGDFLNKKAESCDFFNKGAVETFATDYENGKLLRAQTQGGKSCLGFNLPNLANRIGYLITVKSRNISGKPFLFWIENNNIQRADLETYLPAGKEMKTSYFIQPPMREFDIGYGLHFDSLAIGREESVNDLEGFTVNPVPYWFLTGIKIVDGGMRTINCELGIANCELNTMANSDKITVLHPNASFYRVNIKNADSKYLILSQAYDEGWTAIGIRNSKFEIRKLPHLLINNWENGWEITGGQDDRMTVSSQTIYLFYWPQVLEYLGFGLLIGTSIFILIKKKLFKY